MCQMEGFCTRSGIVRLTVINHPTHNVQLREGMLPRALSLLTPTLAVKHIYKCMQQQARQSIQECHITSQKEPRIHSNHFSKWPNPFQRRSIWPDRRPPCTMPAMQCGKVDCCGQYNATFCTSKQTSCTDGRF